ncbi:MAG: lipid A biosynthesis acyltransferase [Sphingobacteriales bacterium]|nr:MAG: lipid A biosynthesis acyltransferase [Sphingobacteriales bacterium]
MYYLLYGFLYLVSLLPLRVLYLISDAAYGLVYHVLGYRKKVVLDNLRIAFPNKTEAERKAIARKFYHNFTDTFIETIKFISAPPSFFRKHYVADFSIVHEIYKDGRSVHFHIGHNFNWELVNLAMQAHLPGPHIGVYLPLTSKPVDRLFYKIRSRFGVKLVAAFRMAREMMPFRGQQYILGLIADQSPAVPSKAYWTNFFGKPTAFLKTPEDAARRNDNPVFFYHSTRPRRGHYVGHVQLASAHPSQLQPGELTKLYAAYLQQVMTEHPELWLWSHRRWKHEWKPEYGAVLK